MQLYFGVNGVQSPKSCIHTQRVNANCNWRMSKIMWVRPAEAMCVCSERDRHCGWGGIHTQLPRGLKGLINTFEYLKWLVTTLRLCVWGAAACCRHSITSVESSLPETIMTAWESVWDCFAWNVTVDLHVRNNLDVCILCVCVCVTILLAAAVVAVVKLVVFFQAKGRICAFVWGCLALHTWAQLTQFRNFMQTSVCARCCRKGLFVQTSPRPCSPHPGVKSF